MLITLFTVWFVGYTFFALLRGVKTGRTNILDPYLLLWPLPMAVGVIGIILSVIGRVILTAFSFALNLYAKLRKGVLTSD